MFVSIKTKLNQKLENIDSCLLRGEYKLNIYSRYALPSMRYYMSIHHIHKTHMDQLDTSARKYLKKWLNIQNHGVSDASVFHPYMLGVKLPSQLYKEAHAGTYAMIRMKGDTLVNHALNSRLQREEKWTRKYSTTKEMQSMWKENVSQGLVKPPSEESAPVKYAELQNAKKAMKKSIQSENLSKWNNKVKLLTFQGDFIKLQIEEEEDVAWKSVVNNVPKSILSFALKASINGLNTPDNLLRWGKTKSNKCDLCKNWCNLEHILNWCSVSKDQNRTTWRHNSVLNHMTLQIKEAQKSDITMYADIPGHKFNNGTIPPDVILTSDRPDLVIIDRKKKSIDLLELTCSFEKNIKSAHIKKDLKYQEIKFGLQRAGWQVNLIPFEIGSRGLVTKSNKINIINTFKRHHIKVKHKKLIAELAKISLLCSYVIYQARGEPTWQEPPFLKP